MPFLFVDYDQGAGGEFFCSQLSQTEQCNSLSTLINEKNRVKIQDVFNQAWLDPAAKVEYREPDPVKFDVVPTHHRTPEAKKMLKSVKSIRIASATDDHLWSFLKNNQKNKVLLTTQKQNGIYFLGDLKLAVKRSNSTEWLRKVNANTTNLDIRLLSNNIEPSESSKLEYIRKLYNTREQDPEFDWDLVIPYEKFFFDTFWIVTQLKQKFNIELPEQSLEKFYKQYVDFALNPSS